MARRKLELERKVEMDGTVRLEINGVPGVATPEITEGYWRYRVRLSETQSIVGFPKFFTVGIGFAVEEDWNTNLPYTCDTERIYSHIRGNKGDKRISKAACLEAIRMIQDAAKADKERMAKLRVIPGGGA